MEESEHSVDVDRGQEPDILARLRTAPDNASILFELQAYYKEHSQYDDEVAILRQLLEKDLPAAEQAEALHDLVYALYHQGNQEEAILRAEDLLNAYPDYRYLGSVFWLLGVMYANRANWSERPEAWKPDITAAIRNLRRATEHVDNEQERVAVLVELGAALGSSGELAEAQRAFEQALDIGIEDPVTLASCFQRLGRILYRLDQVEQAKRCYEQSVLVCPEQPSNFRALAYVDLAGLYREQGDITRAEQYCLQARQVVDDSSPNGISVALGSIYEELGDISFQKGEYQRAADNYEAALEQVQIPEKQGELYYKLSVALRWDGQHERALEVLRQALALGLSSQPTNEVHIGELLFQMGQCAYSLSDFHQATVLLERATEKVKPPVLAEVYLLLGHSYSRLKRFKKAAEFYGKALGETKPLSSNWRQAVRHFVWAKIAR